MAYLSTAHCRYDQAGSTRKEEVSEKLSNEKGVIKGEETPPPDNKILQASN